MGTEESGTEKHSIEKRRFPRYQVGLAIELRPEGAPAPSRTQTSEVSLGGCYVETNFTLALGTKLHVNFWVHDEKLSTDAMIVTNHPGFGNGMRFENLSREDLEKLKRFLDTLEP